MSQIHTTHHDAPRRTHDFILGPVWRSGKPSGGFMRNPYDTPQRTQEFECSGKPSEWLHGTLPLPLPLTLTLRLNLTLTVTSWQIETRLYTQCQW